MLKNSSHSSNIKELEMINLEYKRDISRFTNTSKMFEDMIEKSNTDKSKFGLGFEMNLHLKHP